MPRGAPASLDHSQGRRRCNLRPKISPIGPAIGRVLLLLPKMFADPCAGPRKLPSPGFCSLGPLSRSCRRVFVPLASPEQCDSFQLFLLFKIMKADIHPNYIETTIACACGAVYRTRSTRRDIKIGICAACHPFFTGEQKFVDTAGRVEKFARRYGRTLVAKGKSK
jgi:large subunit ribosomal protein L31